MNDFFSAAALRSAYPYEKPKVITSIAMFYDLENPHAFVGDIKASLHEEGIWVLELSYLPLMLKMNSFDTLCHEHLEYYSLAPMERLFSEHDLEVVDVTLNGCNGGSFRIAVGHKGKVKPTPEAIERVQVLRLEEFELALDTDAPYAAFRKTSKNSQRHARLPAQSQKSRKTRAWLRRFDQGNTTLQYIGITPDLVPAVADRNPVKYGSFTIARISPSSGGKNRAQKPDYYLVLRRGTSWTNSRSAKLISSNAAAGSVAYAHGSPRRQITHDEARSHHGHRRQDGTYLARWLCTKATRCMACAPAIRP